MINPIRVRVNIRNKTTNMLTEITSMNTRYADKSVVNRVNAAKSSASGTR